MDTSQTDDSVVLTNDPLDVVEHVLTAENLPFDRTDDVLSGSDVHSFQQEG